MPGRDRWRSVDRAIGRPEKPTTADPEPVARYGTDRLTPGRIHARGTIRRVSSGGGPSSGRDRSPIVVILRVGDRWHTGRGLEGMAHRRGGEHSRPDDSTSIASAEPRGWNARTSAPVATGPGARRVNREGGGRPTRAVSISGRPRSVGVGGWSSRGGRLRQFHPGTGLPVGSDIRTDLDSGRQPGDHPAERTGGAPVLSI